MHIAHISEIDSVNLTETIHRLLDDLLDVIRCTEVGLKWF